MGNETQSFKGFLASLELGKIKSGKDIDAIIEQAKKEGFDVPESFADKKEFLKELIVLSAEETEPSSTPTTDPDPATPDAPEPPKEEEDGPKPEADNVPAKKQAQKRAQAAQNSDPAEPKQYQGSVITSESTRVMHGNTYYQIVCANGQTYMLSKDEYAKEVK
jgi:outer membrane biosynthesis protein TonB